MLPEDPGRECIRDWASTVLETLRSEERGEGGGEGGSGLVCVGMACVQAEEGKWRDFCDLLEKGDFP